METTRTGPSLQLDNDNNNQLIDKLLISDEDNMNLDIKDIRQCLIDDKITRTRDRVLKPGRLEKVHVGSSRNRLFLSASCNDKTSIATTR